MDIDGITYSACSMARGTKWKLWSDYTGENKKIFSKEFEEGETMSVLEMIRNPNRNVS